jgi:hypothetical protein
MIRIEIESRAKDFKGKVYSSWKGETKYFKTLKEALSWFRQTYKGKKTKIMYRDTDTGAQRIGYVVSFRNTDYDSHSGKTIKFIQEDWVSIAEENITYPNRWR